MELHALVNEQDMTQEQNESIRHIQGSLRDPHAANTTPIQNARITPPPPLDT